MPKTLCFRTPGRCLGSLWLFVVPLAAVVLLAAPGMADEKQKGIPTLEEALKLQAPAIRAVLWDKMKPPQEKSLHIGVVKFLVQLGNRSPSDNAGPLNWQIARRLEAALILTLDLKEEDTFRIVHLNDPSKELMRKANHLTKEGRKAFFQKDYLPAWGTDETIKAHVFLTGLVKIAYGKRTMQVAVKAFDETGNEPEEVCSFSVAAEPRLLTEAGVSFALSRGDDGFDKLTANWDKQEFSVADQEKPKPGFKPKGPTIGQLLEEAPIEFQVLYQKKGEDKAKPVAIEEDGTLREEPAAGTEVSFRLKHKNQDKHTYGVVVKVNGDNTICPDEVEPDDFRAHKWVLEPKANYFIPGYLRKGLDNNANAAKFFVLPAPASKLKEVNYGQHAGTITLVIFLGRTDGKQQPEGKDSKVALRAYSRGMPEKLEKPPNTLMALKGELQDKADLTKHPRNGGSRGLIEPGADTKLDVDTVNCPTYPTPVSVIQLRYYHPQSRD